MIPTLQNQEEEDKDNISLGIERSHQIFFIAKPKDLVLADEEAEGRKEVGGSGVCIRYATIGSLGFLSRT